MRNCMPRACAAALLFALLSLTLPGFATRTAAAPAPSSPLAPGACVAFPQTGKTVSALFLDYWQQHGGLAQQGYPISDMVWEQSPVDGKPYVVQYFERAVFEWHPENQAPYNVLLSLLGTFRYHQLYPNGAPGQVPNTGADSVLFAQTGHRVGGAFLSYWQTHGGVAQQGYPISDEFDERSPLDGKVYRVQYFERAVFEWHPENAAPNDVLLSQLGTFRDQERYPTGLAAGNLVAAQCTTTGQPTTPPITQPTPAPSPTPASGGETLQNLLNFAAGDINAYWQQVFADTHQPYQGPRQVLGYTQRITTGCGRAPLNNAFYCDQDHSIYYDLNLMNDQLRTDGDFAPVTILAHEWGHLLQDDLGIPTARYPSMEIELQADCYAGAYAQHADQAGLLQQGDLQEATTSLFNAGDQQTLPWFDPQAHGSPQERVDSFNKGYQGGPTSCTLP